MPRLQRKKLSEPDEVRRFANGCVEVVELDEISVARFRFEPGWTWLNDIKPVAGTPTCEHRHVGYTISGTIAVRMDDGTELRIGPGDAYEIPPGHIAWVEGDEAWDSVEFTSAHTYGLSPEDLGERVLRTILFTDIVDSTRMLQDMGDHAWTEKVRRHNEEVRRTIDRHRGRELATLGDGFLVVFDGAARAVVAAAEMDRAVEHLGLQLRAGIHTGEVQIVGGQARGVAVHAAARIAEVAAGGEVFVSNTTLELLDGAGLEFSSAGRFELKGLKGERELHKLLQ